MRAGSASLATWALPTPPGLALRSWLGRFRPTVAARCRRMLHRDVKSLNVFLTGPLDGQGRHTQFKLGDVGVSKVRGQG